MKRIAALLFSSAAIVLPATAVLGAPAQPAGFECNSVDQAGNVPAPIADGILRCGDNRNT